MSRLYADDSSERAAAIAATRALLPLAPALDDAVFQLVTNSANKLNTAALALFEHGAESKPPTDAPKALDQFTKTDEPRTLKIDLSELADDDEDKADERRSSLTKQLLELLHPSHFERSSTAWASTLACVQELCCQLSDNVSAQVVPCLIELVEVANELKLAEMTKRLLSALACIAESSADEMEEHSELFLRELGSLKAEKSSCRMALATTLFRVLQCSSSIEANDAKKELDRILIDAPYSTQADRYELATVAMAHGHFRLGRDLVTVVAAATDMECFGGWLRALRAFSDAEALVILDTRVGLSSIYQLSRATTYLKAATTSSCEFAFQLRVVELRLQWSQLVLQAQQFAGEAAFSNSRGAGREEALRDRFQAVASQFRSLRSTLLGASACDLDALEGHARISELLATAIDSFLLLDTAASFGYGALNSQQTRSYLWRTCEALDAHVREKGETLERIDASRRAALGGRVMKQLLKTVCSIPCALPQQFFRLTTRPSEQRIASNAQFLTSVENTAFTSKPRPRSQLGVPFGTDFNSLLKGGIEVDCVAKSFWQEMVTTLEIEVLVSLVDKTAPCASSSSITKLPLQDQDKNVYARIHKQIPVDWSKAVQQSTTTGSSSPLYLSFEIPVHVRAESLCVKGSFQLRAKVVAVDAHGGEWPLAPTGCTRGFIVY